MDTFSPHTPSDSRSQARCAAKIAGRENGAKTDVTFENTSETEPLVTLRYFGLEVNPDAPAMGAYRKNKFN